MHIPMPGKGAIWIEWTARAWSPLIEKNGGEYHGWLGRLHAILTPPWWQPIRAT